MRCAIRPHRTSRRTWAMLAWRFERLDLVLREDFEVQQQAARARAAEARRARSAHCRARSANAPSKPAQRCLLARGTHDCRDGCEPRARGNRSARSHRRGAPGAGTAGVPHRRPAGHRGARSARSRARGAAEHARFEFPRGASPSTSRPPTCRRIPAASTCRSRSASSRPAASSRRKRCGDYEFAGELSLTGELRAIRGALAMALSARAARTRVRPAEGNAPQAALAEGARVLPARTLLEVVAHLAGEAPLAEYSQSAPRSTRTRTPISATCAASSRSSARSKSPRRAATAC